jgi:divalent metal cation (Fe/Co/Zn/Cd) transporter
MDTGEEGAMRPRAALLKRGLLLEYVTLGWNVVGTIVMVAAAFAARSVALAGFGLDSLIEIFASVVVVWHKSIATGQRSGTPCQISKATHRALHVIG